MKQNIRTTIAALFSIGILTLSMFAVGCTPSDKQDPDARIPNVPPSNRAAPGGDGGDGGGAPGVAKPPGK